MNKFIVQIESAEFRQGLVEKFEKVGVPTSPLSNFLIVQTVKPMGAIASCQGVVMVEPEGYGEPCAVVNQVSPPPWALGWISNSGGNYTNPNSGEGVDVYVVDTGVRGTHVDLIGRVRDLYSHDGLPYSETGVAPSHGTSVAACAAGKLYGTAKDATIVSCRTNFLTSDIVKAYDVALADHVAKPDNRPSIMNLSFTSPSFLLGTITARLADYGIVLVAASGNDGENRPRYPAGAERVVSVGALNQQNEPASFTNKTCDVYVAGENITTAHVNGDTAKTVTSGTSFSAPYYAGLLACLLEGSDKFNSRDLVSRFLLTSGEQIMETNRIPNFNNFGLPIRTPTTKSYDYYVSPSRLLSDQELIDILVPAITKADGSLSMMKLALLCNEYNISEARMSRMAAVFGIMDVDSIFLAAGVRPWWLA